VWSKAPLIRAFSEAVQKKCSLNGASTFTSGKLKKVVRFAFTDEERPRNLVTFGQKKICIAKELK
jgi:hypothetical protein